MKRAGIPALVLLGAALALGGCSAHSAASSLSSLERQATDDDRLPDGLGRAWTPEELDQASVRLLATTSGNRIFAGYAKDKSEVCAVYLPARPDQGWFGGCSALDDPDPQLLYMSGIGYNQSMIVVRDNADTRDLESTGWTKVGENTLVPAS
ncbi:hypothetical protein ACFY5D_07375 [Paeniglutamicibacter sp. NPDC012692]|uniref:hypothetical protein n=1 Tax=Paeniglutamicibacter sp. NPDC012692 TaxID=3364388 RepID=UPI0036B964E4